jgi:L-lactate dehydrogenase complex protein LldE
VTPPAFPRSAGEGGPAGPEEGVHLAATNRRKNLCFLSPDEKPVKVGLFIPCYVNALHPEAGVAAYRLLEHFGVDVDYPLAQTCCGQAMANGGFESEALPLACRFDRLFRSCDYIVAPSASCVAFVREKYPEMLAKDARPCLGGGRIYELCEFLYDVLEVGEMPGHFPHKVSVHNSCHGVRGLRLSSGSELMIPRYSRIIDLLSRVDGIEILEPRRPDECCGFGGMFAVEEAAVSVCMGEDKIRNHLATGAKVVTGADSACLMHMQGIAQRERLPLRFLHVAQILAAGL